MRERGGLAGERMRIREIERGLREETGGSRRIRRKED